MLAWREALSEAASAPAEAYCPECGRAAANKRRQEVHVESQVGALQIGRTYYYCPHCKAGFFPLDEQSHLSRRRLSTNVAHVMTWLSGLLPYREVCAVLERVGQIKVSASMVWREVQIRGTAFRAAEAPGAVGAVVFEDTLAEDVGREGCAKRLGCSLDGGG